jgi:hypothetical protein
MQHELPFRVFAVFWTLSIVSGVDGKFLEIMNTSNFHMDIFGSEIEIDDLCLVCNPTPCLNSGQCIALNGNTDFYCICPTNLPVTGKRCDVLTIGSTTGSFLLFLTFI